MTYGNYQMLIIDLFIHRLYINNSILLSLLRGAKKLFTHRKPF